MKYLHCIFLLLTALACQITQAQTADELNQQLMRCAGESDKLERNTCFTSLSPEKPDMGTEALQRREKALTMATKLLTAPSLNDADLCILQGDFIRNGPSTVALLKAKNDPDRNAAMAEAIGDLPKEMRRRKLIVNEAKMAQKQIGIGDSICQMYASLGTPNKANRTVTANGTHTQHVYGNNLLVYTNNGRVTSWQD